MLEIKFTEQGYEPNHPFTERLFEPSKSTIVSVVCESLYYGDPQHLANDVCHYMNSFMPNNYTIKTNYVFLNSRTGVDEDGKFYVELLTFQVYIDY